MGEAQRWKRIGGAMFGGGQGPTDQWPGTPTSGLQSRLISPRGMEIYEKASGAEAVITGWAEGPSCYVARNAAAGVTTAKGIPQACFPPSFKSNEEVSAAMAYIPLDVKMPADYQLNLPQVDEYGMDVGANFLLHATPPEPKQVASPPTVMGPNSATTTKATATTPGCGLDPGAEARMVGIEKKMSEILDKVGAIQDERKGSLTKRRHAPDDKVANRPGRLSRMARTWARRASRRS